MTQKKEVLFAAGDLGAIDVRAMICPFATAESPDVLRFHERVQFPVIPASPKWKIRRV